MCVRVRVVLSHLSDRLFVACCSHAAALLLYWCVRVSCCSFKTSRSFDDSAVLLFKRVGLSQVWLCSLNTWTVLCVSNYVGSTGPVGKPKVSNGITHSRYVEQTQIGAYFFNMKLF